MLTYTWQVAPISVTNDGTNNLNQIIQDVMVNVIGDYEGDRVISSRHIRLKSPEVQSFIPYQNVTEQQVLNWVQTELGQDVINSIEQDLTNQMNNILALRAKATTATTALVPPWVTPSGS